MQTLTQDIRFGLRTFVRNPGFTSIAVLTLAVGISANTTMFSWINSTLLKPIPGVKNASGFVTFARGGGNEYSTPPCSYLDYVDLRERSQSFSGLMAYHDDWMSLTENGRPDRVYGAIVSANYFDVLGVRPILGRSFLPEEERKPGGAPVVVISHGLWRNRFASDRAILGRTVSINRHLYTLIGVAPPSFQGSKTGLRTDVWVPLAMAKAITTNEQLAQRDNFWLNVLGRLKPGVTRQQAQEEVDLLMGRIAEQFPQAHKDAWLLRLDPLWRSPIGANSFLAVFLPMLLATAGVVLLLACANVANLVLVRSVGRRRELAIRVSMGASRWRLLRQLFIENLMLALLAGVVAFIVTTWTAGTFHRLIPPVNLPLAFNMHVDRMVFLATLGFSLLTGLVFGILPALRSARVSPALVLKEEAGSVAGGLHKSRLASALVVAQIALSMLLLICAGLFARSLKNAQQTNPGFDPAQVLLATFDLLPAGYSREQGVEFYHQLLARLESLPGVESATLADWVPLGLNNRTSIILPEGYVPQPHESMEIGRSYVGPNYLRTLRIPLVAGRDLSPNDAGRKTQPVVVITERLAARYWPGQRALGKQIQLEGRSWTVVGVAKDFKTENLLEPKRPFIFVPLLQNYYNEATLYVRVSGDPLSYAGTVAKTLHESNKDLPLYDVTTLQQRARLGSLQPRMAGTVIGAFGLLALVLAAIGIYGVVAYTTRQRTHEIGIRMALGGQKADVYKLVLLQGLRLTLVGLGIGLALSLQVTPLLRAQLFGVGTTDLATYASVTVLLCLTALAACYLPARRATRVSPMAALRYE